MALIRIVSVKPLQPFLVEMALTTGEVIKRDIGALMDGPIFDAIRADPVQFQQVRVENGTLAWPGEIDLCPDAVIWGGLPPADSASHAA